MTPAELKQAGQMESLWATTPDDCYTPRWVFDAMGLRFDLDVAAPPGGPWHVPCERFYTAADDGLTSPWGGLIFCNPPYSNFLPWSYRWSEHPTGVLMGMVWPNAWFRRVFSAADAITFSAVEFAGPNGKTVKLRQQVFVAFRGVGVEPAERLAHADKYGAVLYGKRVA
jgi:hypothetical protein